MKIQKAIPAIIGTALAVFPTMTWAKPVTYEVPANIPREQIALMGNRDPEMQECVPVDFSEESIPGTNKAHLAARYTHLHQGIDLTPPASISDAEAMRLPIMAWRAGIVTSVEKSWGAVRVTHVGGERSVYGHLSSIRVKPGDIVLACEVIGTMGRTHTQKIPIHLHFEIWSNRVSLNPMVRLKQSPDIIVIGTSKGFPTLR
jgi:hypothetical protein